MDSGLKLYIREWRKARGMTQWELADAISRDKSIISKIENGASAVTSTSIVGIARALGVNPVALHGLPPPGTRPIRDDEAGQVGSVRVLKPESAPTSAKNSTDFPVITNARGEESDMVLPVNMDEIAEWIHRPEPLANVANGFAVYVVGNSMEPAYRNGDLILIHPTRPPSEGDDVLIIKTPKNGEKPAFIRTLDAMFSRKLRFKAYNVRDVLEIPREEIESVNLIVGRYNRC